MVLFGLYCGQIVAAETIHTWIDAEGVRHYSQLPPPDGSHSVGTLELETPDLTESTIPLEQRVRTILDVARELELSRQEREQQYADQAAANAATKSATTPAPNVYDSDPDRIFLPYPYAMPYPPKQYPHWKDKLPMPGKPDEHEPRPPKSRIIMPSQESVPDR